MQKVPSFKAEYFDNLYALEAESFWFKARNSIITWALSKYFPDARNLLEVGCGTGFVLSGIHKAFPKLELTGSELFEEGLGFAQKRLPAAQLLTLDAREMSFRGEFDIVGAFDVLEHIVEDELVLEQMRVAVTPGSGGIMLTVPQHGFLWSAADEYACHVRRYSANELTNKVEKAGFNVTRLTSFVSLLLPAMLLSRVASKSIDQFEPYAEFQISQNLNRILEQIMSVERGIIRAGINLPVGGSLLLVATIRQ
ncbi:MAG: class I SAM-dependent methyltransferase [Candidatus Obscuribacterales bacterium]